MADKVVSRYAPSPTGPQHIGGIRTALYSYLFAQKNKGTSILRIEDTDQTRYVKGAEEFIIESVNWTGMSFDEGPHVGGPNAPYRQSERSEMYQKYAGQLVESGKAYIAFDTPEEIEAMRERLEATGVVMPTYNYATRGTMKNSLTLSKEEVQSKIDAGEEYVIRMLVPPKEEVRFQDIVRDSVVIHSSQVDDKVLLKSDGLPTYHLANVVDDHEMGVTHVIRGEEWLPSTPLHVLMYRAFGWEDTMPKFAHLPLILKPDPAVIVQNKGRKKEMIKKLPDMYLEANPEVGEAFRNKGEAFLQQAMRDPVTFQNKLKEDEKDKDDLAQFKAWLRDQLYGKLSKRDRELHGIPIFPITWNDPETGESAVGYRNMGYLPEAFMNYLALLGWNPGNDQEIMSMTEMIDQFSLEKVHKSPAKFDLDKLNHFQAHYLRQKPAAEWLPDLKTELGAAGFESFSDDYLEKVVELMRERVIFIKEIPANGAFFFQAPQQYDENMARKKWNVQASGLMTELTEMLEGLEDWTAETIDQVIHDFMEAKEVGFGQVGAPLRLALTGISYGPGIGGIAETIGKTDTLERIRHAIEVLEPVG